MTRKPGTVTVEPAIVRVSAPPIVQSTTMKVEAERNAEMTPAMKSTGDSVAIRKSSAMRASGFCVVAADQVQLIVTAVCEPSRDNCGREPGTPAALNHHAKENLCNDKAAASEHERHENGTQEIDGAGVALLNGVKNCTVPDIDPILEADIDAYQDQKPDRAWPGEPVAAAAPVTARADPETFQQVSLARLLGFLRCQFWIRIDKIRRRALVLDLKLDFDSRYLFLARLFGVRWFGPINRFRLDFGPGHNGDNGLKNKKFHDVPFSCQLHRLCPALPSVALGSSDVDGKAERQTSSQVRRSELGLQSDDGKDLDPFRIGRKSDQDTAKV